MSEPLTSHEIEDVLSSIRRLVSEDLRPARAAMAAAQATKAAPVAEAEKLMLTPALRVVPDVIAEPAVGASTAPDAVVADTDDVAVDFAQGVEFPLPTPGDVSDEPDGFDGDQTVEAGGNEPLGLGPDLAAAFPDPTAEIYDDAGLGDESPLSPMMAATDDVLWAAPGEVEPGETELVEDLVTAPAAATQVHGHWTAQDLPGVDWVEEESDWAEPSPIPFVAHPRKPDLTVDPLARAWADRAEEAVRAELGGVSTAMPPPAAPEPQAEVARGPGLFDGDEAELDEEMLREIVRDIIREELAGALGERITRNVRKLVRVEINRALAAREFE
jgi:hypothetical protein